MAKPSDIEAFIRRWEKASGTERANYQLFLTELCKLLDLPQLLETLESVGRARKVKDGWIAAV